MKTSTLMRNGVSQQMVNLIARLVDLIPWPVRRSAMGDVVLSILDSKPRVAEDVFGWNRTTVELGMNECRTKILCVSDLQPDASRRRRRRIPDCWVILLRSWILTAKPKRGCGRHFCIRI